VSCLHCDFIRGICGPPTTRQVVWLLLVLFIVTCYTGLAGGHVSVCRVLSVYGKESYSPGGCSCSRGKYVACGELFYCPRSCCHHMC